jgi:hypothetical protein
MRYLTLVLLAACVRAEPQQQVLSQSPAPGKAADSTSMKAIAIDRTSRTADTAAAISHPDTLAEQRPYSSAYRPLQPDTAALAAARADGKASRDGSELLIKRLMEKVAPVR